MAPTVKHFEDLEAWQTARQLTRLVYTLSNEGPFAKDYTLRDQMRRAAVSILSNIAEGFESRTRAQMVDFLGRAKASAGEVRAQSYVAMDLDYLTQTEFENLHDLADKVVRQLHRFIAYLESEPDLRRVREGTEEYDVSGQPLA